jgi:hypothetical protein
LISDYFALVVWLNLLWKKIYWIGLSVRFLKKFEAMKDWRNEWLGSFGGFRSVWLIDCFWGVRMDDLCKKKVRK